MAKSSRYKKSKRGLSTVVTAVILIALSMAALTLVWVFVSNMVKKQIKTSESCYGNYDKIQINGQYTCFNKTSPTNYDLHFSLSIGDVTVDKVIVSVSSASVTKSYEITNVPQAIIGLSMYPSGISLVNLSGKNAGLTYKATGFSAKIDSIEIAPYIGGTMCETSDSLPEIEDCNLVL